MKQKVYKASSLLALIGIALIVIFFIVSLFNQCPSYKVYCSGNGNGFFILLMFGLIPGLFLLAIALILFLIRKFKN